MEESDSNYKKQKKFPDKNEEAYQALLLLMDDDTSTGRDIFNIVDGSCSTRFPNKDEKTAWEKWDKKYVPKSAPSRVALANDITEIKLKKMRDDRDELLTHQEMFSVKLSKVNKITAEEEVMDHALDSLAREFKSVLTKVEDKLGSTTELLIIKKLGEYLSLKYQRLNGIAEKSSNNTETALFSAGLNGKCNN